ncbi:hypothetical protein, partial [Streptomyces sp.]|uniref:hypothetical protein n=1 Tax=Streptomyces sp. TaxID=1931 RepID=UPI0028127465
MRVHGRLVTTTGSVAAGAVGRAARPRYDIGTTGRVRFRCGTGTARRVRPRCGTGPGVPRRAGGTAGRWPQGRPGHRHEVR